MFQKTIMLMQIILSTWGVINNSYLEKMVAHYKRSFLEDLKDLPHVNITGIYF